METRTKTRVFVNLSNHNSSKWSEKQRLAIKEYADEIIDIAFPNVDPFMTTSDIRKLVEEYLEKIDEYNTVNTEVTAVHVMGEMCFVYNIVDSIKDTTAIMDWDCKVLCSTTDRKVVEIQNPDGTTTKTTNFEFVQFREY